MKRIFFLTVLLFAGMAVFAQSGSALKVKWSFSSKKINDKTYELRLSAMVDGNYHIYAQNVGVDGPVATSFTFNKNPLVTLSGKVKEEGKIVKKHEEVWNGNVNFYEKKVDFVQLVQLKSKVKTNVGGTVEFMVCDDKQCLPPAEVNFKIDIGG
ncbi:MAG: sugar transporter [Chitinophagaceae bacterium]|nr:sugar transporter [Chitinophagaceae bacterium]